MSDNKIIGVPLGSDEIEQFLNGEGQEIDGFVCSLKQLDIKNPFGENRYSRIIFIENPEGGVGHFTLISDFGEYIEYFDSLAGPIPEKIKMINKQIRYLVKPLQGKTSNVCGKWAIIRSQSLPTDLDEFVEIFTRKLKPDQIVDRILHLKINK